MAKQVNNYGTGTNFFGLLTLIFITLKLTHYIDWSWWWVLAPIWIPISIGLLVMLIVIAIHVRK